jgi:hypothetical protein
MAKKIPQSVFDRFENCPDSSFSIWLVEHGFNNRSYVESIQLSKVGNSLDLLKGNRYKDDWKFKTVHESMSDFGRVAEILDDYYSQDRMVIYCTNLDQTTIEGASIIEGFHFARSAILKILSEPRIVPGTLCPIW